MFALDEGFHLPPRQDTAGPPLPGCGPVLRVAQCGTTTIVTCLSFSAPYFAVYRLELWGSRWEQVPFH